MAEIKGNLDVQDIKISGTATIKNTPVATKVNGLPADENNNIDLTKWGTVQSSTSLNSHVDTGFFTFESTSTDGSPVSLTSNGYNATLIDINTNPKNITTNIQTQLVITEENKIFVRSKKSKIYSDWDELATQKWVIDNGGSGSTDSYTKDEADAKFLPITSNKKATVGSLTIDIGTTSVAPITFVTDQEPYTFNFPKKSGTLLTEEDANTKFALKEFFYYSSSTKQTHIETLDKQFTLIVGNNGRFGIWSRDLGTSLVAFDSTGTMYAGLIPVSTGGTGGKTAAEARTNLQIYSKGESDSRYINQTESAINYRTGGHAYIRYNEGTSGRRAYVGFPSDGSTTFTIANEHPTNSKMSFKAKDGFSFDASIFSDGNIVSKKLNFQVQKNGGYPRVEMGINEASNIPHVAWKESDATPWQLIYYPNETGTFATREWTNQYVRSGNANTETILQAREGGGDSFVFVRSSDMNIGMYLNGSTKFRIKETAITTESGCRTFAINGRSNSTSERPQLILDSVADLWRIEPDGSGMLQISHNATGTNWEFGKVGGNQRVASQQWVNAQGFSKGGMNTGLTSVWKGNWGTGSGAIRMSRSISYRFVLIRTEGGQHYTAFVGYDGEYTVAYSGWRTRFAVSGGGMTLSVVEEANCRFAEIYIIGA